MPGFHPNRREALKRIALLGAAGVIPAILPVFPARAADLNAGFVYIGPRDDWGWNQSQAVAAAALKGVPSVKVLRPATFRKAPTMEAARTTPKRGPTPRRWRT